jgi:cbb3-type cytochrome oxidase maturation protein
MSVIVILILASLGVAVVFLVSFIWAVRSGQYEDTCTPALRILADEPAEKTSAPISKTKSSNS